MKDKKILIIGGAGFLGKRIASRLEKEFFGNVSIADISKSNITNDTKFVFLDVLDFKNIHDVIQDFDVIINCTGQITNPINTCLKINTIGIDNLVNALTLFPGKKLYHVSTVSVYGTCDVANEETLTNPETPYSTSKVLAEFLISKTPKLDHAILRVPNLYGENQAKGIISYLFRSLNSDSKLFFNNDGNLIRHYLHIDDCAEAIFLAIKNDISGIYNIPSIEKKTIIELIKIFTNSFKVNFKVELEQTKPFENINFLISNNFYNKTGFVPKNTIKAFVNKSHN